MHEQSVYIVMLFKFTYENWGGEVGELGGGGIPMCTIIIIHSTVLRDFSAV